MEANFFKSLRDDYPIKEFQQDMLHEVNMFKESMEATYGMTLSRSRRSWMKDFLRWLDWKTDEELDGQGT